MAAECLRSLADWWGAPTDNHQAVPKPLRDTWKYQKNAPDCAEQISEGMVDHSQQ